MTAPSFSQYCLTVYPFIGPSSFPRMVVSSGFTTIFNPHDWFSMSMSPRLFPPTISGRALINVGITFALPSSCGIGIIISSVNLPLATTDLTPRICVSGNPNSSARNYNPQIQISAESETKRSIFREKDKTKRSKKESAQHSKSRNKSFVMTSVSAL